MMLSFRAPQILEAGNKSPAPGVPTLRMALFHSGSGFGFGFGREHVPERSAVNLDGSAALRQPPQLQIDRFLIALNDFSANLPQLFLRFLDILGDVLQREINFGHAYLLERRIATFTIGKTQADSGGSSRNGESVVDTRQSVKKDCAATLSWDPAGARTDSHLNEWIVG
jgi:hypothetical protein